MGLTSAVAILGFCSVLVLGALARPSCEKLRLHEIGSYYLLANRMLLAGNERLHFMHFFLRPCW